MRTRALAIVAALLALGRSARADPEWKPTAHLDLDPGAIATCPDAPALADAVTARLGYDPFVETSGDLRISVHFTRSGKGISGKVEAFDPADPTGATKGERTVSSARGDCAEVAQAVTVTISILLDPHGGLVTPPPPSKSEPTPFTPEPPPPPPPPPPPAPPSIVPRVRLGILGTIGAEPEASVGARVSFGLETKRFAIGLELRGDLPREHEEAGKRASSGLLLGELVPCLREGWLEACGVFAVGSLRSEVAGGDPPTRATFHMLAGPRGAVVIPLRQRFSLVVDAEALFTLTHTSVRVDGVDVWSPPLLSGALGVALEVRFP